MIFDIDPEQSEITIIDELKDKRWSWVHVDDLGDAYARVARAGPIVNNQLFCVAANGKRILLIFAYLRLNSSTKSLHRIKNG